MATANLNDRGELHELGIAAAARAIRNGEISSEAYVGRLLERAREHVDLNAFITIDDAASLAAARAADKARAQGARAPLLGIPFAVKDSYMTRGLKTSFGTGLLKDYLPREDAPVVAALKSSGAIVIGKNNLVEMSYGLTGLNVHHGQPRNPYDVNRVTGGSSSGGGASVAARLVPVALGGNTVGSIRVPASLCGVAGFKPTPGRWPRDGVAPISHTLDTTGVLARSIEDCTLVDALVTGAKGQGPRSDDGLKGVRLAVAPKQFQDLIDPGVAEIFHDALRKLRQAGAEIIEVDLGEEFTVLARRVTWSLFFNETMPDVTQFLLTNEIPATFQSIYDQLHRTSKRPGLDQFCRPERTTCRTLLLRQSDPVPAGNCKIFTLRCSPEQTGSFCPRLAVPPPRSRNRWRSRSLARGRRHRSSQLTLFRQAALVFPPSVCRWVCPLKGFQSV